MQQVTWKSLYGSGASKYMKREAQLILKVGQKQKGGTMRTLWNTLAWMVAIGLLLGSAPAASAQKRRVMPTPPPPTPMAQQPAQQQVVVVEPIRVFDPFFAYPYPYTYPPDYMAANFGYVKIKTHREDTAVYVDGGFADKVKNVKNFALRAGT